MSTLKIFVTDASGFIGRALIMKMLECGHHIIAARSPFSGVDRPDVSLVQNRENVFNVQLDFSNCSELLSYIADCDCVVHLGHNSQDPLQEQLRFAIDSTQTLLKACVEAQVKKFICISSTAVYGDPPPSVAIAEESPYLSSLKLQTSIYQSVEKLILEMETGDTEVVILQLGRVYGPGAQGETFRMLDRMRTAFIPLARSGTGYCNPIYIDDAARAIVRACEVPNLHRQRFIISLDRPVSWRELLMGYESILEEKALINLPIDYQCEWPDSIPFLRASISTVLQKRKIREGTSAIAKAVWGKTIYYPSADEFRTLVARPIFSNQKARDCLNFQPQISLSTGMEKIRQWWHQNRPEMG